MKKILFTLFIAVFAFFMANAQTMVTFTGGPGEILSNSTTTSADVAVSGLSTCPDGSSILFAGSPLTIMGPVTVSITDVSHSWASDVDFNLVIGGVTLNLSDGNGGNNGLDVMNGFIAPPGCTLDFADANTQDPDPWLSELTFGGCPPPFFAEGGSLDGTFTGIDISGLGNGPEIEFTDNVGGDDGTYAGWTVSFFVDDAEIAAAEAACPMPNEPCIVESPDLVIPLEAGECQEVAFFELTSPNCDICPDNFNQILPAGVADDATALMPTLETFDMNGSLTGVQLDENNTSYAITIPAAGSLAMDIDYDGTSFWDDFEVSLNGATIATGSTAFCEAVMAGDVVELETTDPFGFNDTPGVYEITVTGISLIDPNLLPCIEITQTGGPESGDFLVAGVYTPTFEFSELTLDPGDPCSFIAGDPLETSFNIEVTEYSGPVTEALACNDHVNISLDENCEVLISSDMFLEGGPYACFDDYLVEILAFGGGDPIAIDPAIPVTLPCGDHTAMVTSPLGNTCWGTFTIEDKIVPTFDVVDLAVTCVEDIPVLLVPASSSSEPIILVEEDLTTPAVIVPDASATEFCFDLVASPNCPTLLDMNISVAALHQGNLTMSIVSPSGTEVILWDSGPNGTWSCPGFGTGIMDITIDDDSPGLPLSCVDFQGMGMWNTNTINGSGSLADIEGEDPSGQWCIIFDVNTNFMGQTEIYELSVFVNDLDPACDASPVFPTPMASECECQSYSFSDVTTTSDCGDGTVTRTWVCTDKAGNESEAVVQNITVSPLSIDDVMLPPATLEVPCGTDLSPEGIAAFFDDPSTEDCVDDSDCPDDIYEFNEGADEAYPTYIAWGCNAGCNAKNTEHNQPITSSVCNLFVTYADQDLVGCSEGCRGTEKVIRTWTILDWCTTETFTHVQIIKSGDNEAPQITAQDVSFSVNPWGCVASGVLPAPDHLFDDCSEDLTFTVTGPAGTSVVQTDAGLTAFGLPKGEHEFTYTAVDCCGNVGSSTITVNVVDDTPPTAIAKENIVISLTSGGFSTDGIAKLFPGSVDNGSNDGDCGPVALEIRRTDDAPDCGNIGLNGYNNNLTFNNNRDPDDNNNDTDGGQAVQFCCEDLANDNLQVILRVWDDGNCDGIAGNDGDNFNETWASITLENKLPPVIVCPPDATVTCTSDLLIHDEAAVPTEAELAFLLSPDFGTGIATGAGICGDITVTYEDDVDEDVCFDDYVIEREWCIEGTNICCEQEIQVVKVGAFDPNTISWNSGFPEESIQLSCLEEEELQEPTWLAAPCDIIAWSVESDTFFIEGNAAAAGCIKIINDYTVLDWCADAEFTFTQTITVLDTEAPEIEAEDLCVEVGDDCNAVVELCATGTDMGDCESPWLKWQVLVDLNSDWTIDYEFSTFVPTLDPNFGTGINELHIPQSAPGDKITIEIPEIIASSKLDHRVTWRLSDGCGNFSSVTTLFQVTDKKAPTPYCFSVSSAPHADGGVELWACDFTLGAEDNCSDEFTYTFNGPDEGFDSPESTPGWNPDTNCEGASFDCPDNGATQMVKVYTWDECNNAAICFVELTLSGCEMVDEENGRIAGSVGTESNVMVEDVNMNIASEQPEYPMSIMTDNNGDYDSNDIPAANDYAVSAYKNDDHRNGVSTLDILIIQRHILNLAPLTSPYQYISADANNDQSISAADLVDIRKLVLEITDEFPSNNSWRFADAAQALTVGNAFAFSEVIDILALNGDMMAQDFIANKIGDVNGSVVLNAKGANTDVRSGKNLSLDLTGVATAEGVSIEVTSANFQDILGYQFTMNTNGLELLSVEAGAIDMNDNNVAVLDANTLTVSWNTVDAVSFDNEVLFTLNFAGSDASVVENFDITSDATSAEAYDSGLNVFDVVLGDEITAEFVLGQNEPNPFNTQTTIEFSLPSAGAATLTVMDVTGKVVTTVDGTYAKGINSIILNKSTLAASGVLYYQLESGEFSATKKMIIME